MFKDKVVYQIYPKSFKDSNNDGVGDLKGIIEKLDYLKYLGVDYLWITPFFISPQKDNGYDVEDYYNIDPTYGTMDDFDMLIKESKKRGIELMLDMVFNHTSTEHEWFKKALAGEKKYQDYYIFKKSKNPEIPPTNWESKFGGNAWKYSKEVGMHYLHLFDETQADLNWENPEVRDEMKKIVKFWMNKGVKGFRFDVVNLISKPFIYEDDNIGDGRRFYTDGPKIHEYLKELNIDSFGSDKEVITVGEMSSTTLENCVKYAGENEHELSMVFNFHHLKIDYKNKDKWSLQAPDFEELKSILNEWQLGMQNNHAWTALFWCNHDQPRVVSRLGDDQKNWNKSAKMLATLTHCLRGTPYIYQGEEIGMTNSYFEDIETFKDVESHNYYRILKEKGLTEDEALKVIQARSRDNGRTPVQWDDTTNAGFSEVNPWIKVIQNYKKINVKSQIDDRNSILNYYKELIQLRKKYKVISHGDFKPLLLEEKNIYVYKRNFKNENIIVITNFSEEKTINLSNENINEYRCLLSNTEFINNNGILNLKPYDAIIVYKNL